MFLRLLFTIPTDKTDRLFNVCEDSMLASPLIIDLVLVAEVMTRISWKVHDESGSTKDYKGFHSVLSILSYMLKVRHHTTSSAMADHLRLL